MQSTATTTLGTVVLVCLIFGLRAWQWEIWLRVTTLSFCAACCVYCLWSNDKFGAKPLASGVALLGLSVAVFGSAYSGGGITNFSSVWLLIIPIIGGLIGTTHGTLIGFFMSLVSFGVLSYIELSMGMLPDLTPIEFRDNQARLHQIAALIVGSVAAYSFLRQVKIADQELDVKVNALEVEIQARTLAEQEAVQANRIKSDFLANISHEIRTPINGILGVLQLLEKDDLKAKQKNLVELGLASSETLLGLINDLLDLAKIESGKFIIQQQDFDLQRLFECVHQRTEQLAKNKSIDVRLDLDIDHNWVTGDDLRIEQVLLNLISNAIKFTPEGSVTIEASYKKAQGVLEAHIIDTGIGISNEHTKRIFDPFAQAEASTTRNFGGTGLGLAICKQLINLMNGEFRVSSRVAEGSTFSFSLPCTATTAVITKQPSTTDTRADQFAQKKILLVEDNPTNAELSLFMLEDMCIEADHATNGAEALQMIESEHYDAVLMDCQMPIMDGYQATAAIRRQPEFVALPIIALTANAMSGDREKCLEAGMNDYVAKPINPGELEERLQHWLVT